MTFSKKTDDKVGRRDVTSPELSVIVPTLNEAENVDRLLSALTRQQGIRIEIFVADGGSSDETVAIADRYRVSVIPSARGRGIQMNTGARAAAAPYLLFLHADSGIDDPELLSQALGTLKETARGTGDDRVAGHFRLRFEGGRRCPLVYRHMEAKSALNRSDTTSGDQGFLLSRRFFEELGGFDESWVFLEDQKLADRIHDRGVWITLPGTIETSARRFETEGFERRHLMMAIIMGMYRAGLETFFTRTPEVYRAQGETGRLLVTRFLRSIRKFTGAMPRRERIQVWIDVGRYVKENLWQVFFFFDVLLSGPPGARKKGPETYPLLLFYDRRVSRCLRFRVFDAVTAGLTWLWIMRFLAAWYRVRDRSELKKVL